MGCPSGCWIGKALTVSQAASQVSEVSAVFQDSKRPTVVGRIFLSTVIKNLDLPMYSSLLGLLWFLGVFGLAYEFQSPKHRNALEGPGRNGQIELIPRGTMAECPFCWRICSLTHSAWFKPSMDHDSIAVFSESRSPRPAPTVLLGGPLFHLCRSASMLVL